jgi:hypothetical protein
MRLTYEDFLNDPSLLARIRTEAYRARSEAIGNLIAAAFKRLPSVHAARSPLARQG